MITVFYVASIALLSTLKRLDYAGGATFLWIFFVSCALACHTHKKEMKSLEGELSGKKRKRDTFLAMLEDVKRERRYLDERLTGLSKLYAITKDMSSCMRFADLSHSLKNFLEDNFKFNRFLFIIFKYENDKRTIENILQAGKDLSSKGEINPVLNNLLNSITRTKKPIFLEQDKDLFNFGFEEYITNMLAIPLIARKKVIAAFLIENIVPEDYNKFLILASQVALQVERISLFDDVEKLSITDGLTGTFLRRHFLKRFKEEVLRSSQSGMPLSCIMLDLDHFKRCNDNYGHLVGDVVLKEVVGVLKNNIREIDLIARVGGEEFCILLPETSKTSARIVAERIRKAIEDHPIRAYDESVKMTVSMGISSFPEDSGSPDELIERSDKALYAAKEGGRNRVSLA